MHKHLPFVNYSHSRKAVTLESALTAGSAGFAPSKFSTGFSLAPGPAPVNEGAMRHFLNTSDWTRPELQAMIDDARAMKTAPIGDALKGKTVALLFLNNSLRTRTSFDVGARQLGAHAVVLSPSGGMWPLEFEDGAVMDGEAEEHVPPLHRRHPLQPEDRLVEGSRLLEVLRVERRLQDPHRFPLRPPTQSVGRTIMPVTFGSSTGSRPMPVTLAAGGPCRQAASSASVSA